MTISLIAIASVMAVSWAFGIFCDRMITKWHKSLTEPSEDPDIVRYTCDNCKHKNLSWYDEPCESCTGDKWEEDDETRRFTN